MGKTDFSRIAKNREQEAVSLVNIYILYVFTEKPYDSKSLERNAVYIPITTLSRAKSMTSK